MKLLLAVCLAVFLIINLMIRSKDKYLMIIFNIYNSIGAIVLAIYPQISNFYISDDNIEIILTLYIIINFSFFLVNSYKKDKLTSGDILSSHKTERFIPIIVLLPILIYTTLYFNKLPIYNIFSSSLFSEAERPDVTGAIPRYFSFTLFLLGVYLPLYINIFYKKLELKEIKKALFLMPVLFLPWLIMFDKSSLFEVLFFILFINPVFFKYHKKLSKKRYTTIILLFIILAIFMSYGLVRALYGTAMVNSIETLIKIVFGRIAIISNIVLSKIIDFFMDSSYTLPEGTTLRSFIFQLIYSNREFGGAPTNFVGSIVFWGRNKYLVFLLTLMISIFIFSLRRLIYRLKINKYKFSILYLQYYGAIILSAAYLEDYFLRTLLPILFFIALDNLLSKPLASQKSIILKRSS